MHHIIVIGIGQSLRGDDAVGLTAVNRWQNDYPITSHDHQVKVETSELPGLSLLDLMEDYDAAVLVDAVRSGSPAGTLHILNADNPQAFGDGPGSAHGWGVAETLKLGRLLSPDRLPRNLILIGVEVGQIDLGQSLSLEVEHALSSASQWIEQQVCDFLDRPTEVADLILE